MTSTGQDSMDSSHAALDAAIAELYAAFSGHGFPESLEAAPKHDLPEVLKKLRSAPLDALPPDALGGFAGSALYTIGDVDDYRHFLPRILELSCHRTEWMGFHPAVIARKLVYAGWQDWPPRERTALLRLSDVAWHVARNGNVCDLDADAWLCANGYLGRNASDLLEGWLPLRSPDAALQVAELVTRAWPNLADAPYWEEHDDTYRQAVSAWLFSTSVIQALQGAEAMVADDQRRPISQALKVLKRH